jgi:HSP20 family protein
MTLPRLSRSQELTPDPFRAMRREMENAFRAFDQNLSSPDIGAAHRPLMWRKQRMPSK